MNINANTPREVKRASAPDVNAPAGDSLTAALLYLAAHHGRAVSREALLSGLPITDGKLPVLLVERAAKRAGLESEAVKRAIDEIPALVLPAVLMMRDGTTRILMQSDRERRVGTLLDPLTGKTETDLHFGTIAQNYLGYAFLIRPAAAADPRAIAAGGVPQHHWFWSVVLPFWPNYSHVAISALIINMLGLASPLFIMSVYDRVVPNGALASLIALSIGMVIAIVFDFIMRTVRSRIIDMTGKKVDVVLAANIFEHVLSVKMDKRPMSVGILANQLRDFDSVREFFTSGSVVSAIDLLFAFLFIIVLFIVAGPLAWVPVLIFPAMIAAGLILQKPLNRAMQRLNSESAARHGILVESLSSVETIRASGAEARMQTNWERSVAATARSGEDVHFLSSLALTGANTAQQLTSLLMVIIGVYLILDGKLTVGALVAATMLGGRVLGPISSVAAVITRATQTVTALRGIDRVMNLERERPIDRTYVARRIEQGRFSFENVSFKYPNAAMQALDNVSFSVAAGDRIGVIGRIGSGKTTVGRLLVNFYDPQDGRILIDGIDARQYDPADLRAGVGFVLQDNDLFFGKLRDNIALGKPTATDAEIIEAATLAGVESMIAGHPLGYDMPIAEGGRSLSGGQKQAICLARALIRKPKILFLDEPTAHFDVRSETEFLERLKKIAQKDMTLVVSTHRASLLALVNRILVFDRGRLIADGPRDEILAKLVGTPKATGGQPPLKSASI